MLRKKNKGAFHALSIGKTQGKEVCYRRRYRKKKDTQGTTRKNNQPTPQRPAHALSLQGEKSAVGQIERYVFRITHTTHFCYTSTGPLLLLFFYFLSMTMPTDDEKQARSLRCCCSKP